MGSLLGFDLDVSRLLSMPTRGDFVHDSHVPLDALLERTSPVALAVRPVGVSDDAVRREEVAFITNPSDDSVFALCAFSDDPLASVLGATFAFGDSREDSVTLALTELVVVEPAFGEIS